MSSTKALKANLRNEVQARVQKLSAASIDKQCKDCGEMILNPLAQAVCQQVIKRREWKQSNRVSIYIAMKNELQTDRLIEAAFAQRKTVLVPRISRSAMKMIEIKANQMDSMKMNHYGIKEPEDAEGGQADLVILPGVAFDENKNRLGHGKGYYDRWIQEQPKRPTLLAVALKEQMVDEIPTTEFDQKVDDVIVEVD